MKNNSLDFTIKRLGEHKIKNPIIFSSLNGDRVANYATDDLGVIYDIKYNKGTTSIEVGENGLIEKAGPRSKIYFDPYKVHAAIVTCGGLCPGLNAVIRSIVAALEKGYGVTRITGIRHGFWGLLPESNLRTMDLKYDEVNDIHTTGGTILGSSRGHGNKVEQIVDTLEMMNVNMLFIIGGDGTQRGTLDISREINKRDKKIAVVGIPKTIDNDLSFVQRSFGFETAVSIAVQSVHAAHIEANGFQRCIGIVKVMGRESGFIAAHTALAAMDVNFVLVPEVPFDLEGQNGLLAALEKRLMHKDHAVLLVAEGAGQDLLREQNEMDASGNKKLSDIGLFLKDKISTHFEQKQAPVNVRYIDPGYIIRSAPPNPNDLIYCSRLGANAVHGAMAGRTEFLISMIHDYFVHIPIELATSKRNYIDTDGPFWRDVLSATRQPALMLNNI